MGLLRDIGAPGLILIVLGALLIFGCDPKTHPQLAPDAQAPIMLPLK